MNREDLENKIFVGIVEDNLDPKKLGRIRVRVVNVFDEIPVEDIPWAKPWKDLNGNQFNVPDKGKIVSVVFDSGNIYKPEYIFADHYNKNLEDKLKTLDGANYTSMRALMFDHKTQIYSNDQEGLKMDYKMNNINITNTDINVNLKDNFGHVNIGSANSDQQAILGNHFLEWFDEFIENLLGTKGGPYIGNAGAPVLPNPALIEVINKYKALKEPKFLSHHINLVDNEYVDKQSRPADGQLGDTWKSTVNKNQVVFEPVDYKPKPGNSTDTPDGNITPYVDDNGKAIDPGNTPLPPIVPSSNPDVQKILDAMTRKGYKILNRPYEVNIVGIRRQYEGQRYSNAFKDDLFLIYKVDSSDRWEINKFKISTMPGFYYGNESGDKFKIDRTGKSKTSVKQSKMMLSRGTPPNNGMGILMEAQYLNIYQIGDYHGHPAMKTTGAQKFYRDNSPGDTIKYTGKGQGWAAMYIHKGFPGGATVNNWSEGCQVFAKESDLLRFFDICKLHRDKYGNKFNYTLMLERDL